MLKKQVFLISPSKHLFSKSKPYSSTSYEHVSILTLAGLNKQIFFLSFTETIFIQTRRLWRVCNQPIKAFVIVSSVTRILQLIECKYSGSLGRPGSSCSKARLVRPQEFCFDCASWRLSPSIRFPSSCYVLKSHQRGDLTPAETKVDYLRFAKVLYEERNGFKRFGAANGGTLLSLS